MAVGYGMDYDGSSQVNRNSMGNISKGNSILRGKWVT